MIPLIDNFLLSLLYPFNRKVKIFLVELISIHCWFNLDAYFLKLTLISHKEAL